VIHHARHLQEDQMFDCYVAERAGEALDPPVAEHLADCPPCGARYADLARFMDTLRTDVEVETDAMFPPERLQAQRREIARRIEAVARPARVISFPTQLVRRTMGGSGSRTAPRWAAAAAAAGLFVGIALGASYPWESRIGMTRQGLANNSSDGRGARLAPAASRASHTVDTADDEFLSELELALDRPTTRELAAFDAFTPHVREIRDIR